jgi:hypothetical protein
LPGIGSWIDETDGACPVTSPFVTKLLSDLSVAVDPELKGILLAELGCYWARVGEFAESERIRQKLRRDFGSAQSVRVSILIMVLEGLQLYYKDLSPSARDRMLRASLLSKGFHERGLIARTSAWMAHIELNGARFDSMIAELRTSFSAMPSGDDATDCRLALVLGDACLIAGLPAQSQAWYERARRAANRLGDHAAVGAMTYNRAALRVARYRYERLSEDKLCVDLPLLRLDVQSAVNYQSVAGLRSLEHLLTTTKVGLLMIQEDVSSAMPLIESLLASSDVARQSTQRLLLMSDYALGLATLGNIESAQDQIDGVLAALSGAVPTDDLCLILRSLRDAAAHCQRETQRTDLEVRLQAAIAEHERITGDLRGKLLEFETPVFDRARAFGTRDE